MKLTVYHLKNCDTCKKAIKALQAAGHELVLVDVRDDGISSRDLERLENAVGYEALLNTRSTTWRGLDEAEKSGLDREKALHLLQKHPTLMKRPVVEGDNGITVGWKDDIAARYA